MKTVKTFTLLSFSYAAIWLLPWLHLEYEILGRFIRNDDEAYLLFLSLIFFLPSVFVSYLFYKQTHLKRWLYFSLSIFIFGIIFFVYFLTSPMKGFAAGLILHLSGFLLGLFLYLIITIFACISSNQKNLTRLLGFVSLIVTVFTTIIFIMIIFKIIDKDITIYVFWSPALGTFIVSICSLLSAMFSGIKKKPFTKERLLEKS